MLSKINIYILKKFLLSFFITFLILAVVLFIGDFVEQFRKSAGKDVPIKIILQLTALNFPSLIFFTLPISAFFGSLIGFLLLIRNSEKIILDVSGISNFHSTAPGVILYFIIGVFFITVANPFISILDKKYSELEYKYIDRVDKFASITKNGLWLKQINKEKDVSSVLYAKNIKEQGKKLIDFMVLEYDEKGVFQGRLDGSFANLNNGYWEMYETQISPKYSSSSYQKGALKYQTNIKLEDITDSLSSPSSISIWRLIKFISFLESLGYSAVDFKMHFYSLFFLPFLIGSLAMLSSSLVIDLKQNDRFIRTILLSLISIFGIYFLSNLLDALGNSSQIHPIFAKSILPLLITFISLILIQHSYFQRKKLND